MIANENSAARNQLRDGKCSVTTLTDARGARHCLAGCLCRQDEGRSSEIHSCRLEMYRFAGAVDCARHAQISDSVFYGACNYTYASIPERAMRPAATLLTAIGSELSPISRKKLSALERGRPSELPRYSCWRGELCPPTPASAN